MGVSNIKIIFNDVVINGIPVLEPGLSVYGHVMLTAKKSKHIKGINLLLQGKAEVSFVSNEIRWFKDNSLGGKNDGELGFGSIFDINWNAIKLRRRNSESSRFHAKQILLNINLQLTGETQLAKGDNIFPFSFTLPQDLPSTFKNKYGEIRYKFKVIWSQSGFLSTSDAFKSALQVVNKKTLEFLRIKNFRLFEPRVYHETRPFTSLFSSTNPFSLSLKLPKSAVVNGETILVGVEIDNSTKIKIKSIYVRLVQKTAWVGKSLGSKNIKIKDAVLREMCYDGVAAHTNKSWSQPIVVSAEPTAYIEPCSIMKVCYLIMVEIVPSGYKNVSLMAPIEVCWSSSSLP